MADYKAAVFPEIQKEHIHRVRVKRLDKMQGLRVFFTKLFKSKKNKKRSDEGVAVLLTGLIMVLIGLIILIAVFITGSIPGIAVIFGGFGALVCGLALAYESDNNLWAIGGMAAGIVVALLSGYKYFQSRD
jgi:hypothetical protein